MNEETYPKTGSYALWLVLGEFAGAAIILLLLLLMVVGNLISSGTYSLGYQTGQFITLAIAIVYGLAYLGNLGLAVIGLYLFATEKREGLPVTGHLINWVMVAATLVPVLVLMAAIISSM